MPTVKMANKKTPCLIDKVFKFDGKLSNSSNSASINKNESKTKY